MRLTKYGFSYVHKDLSPSILVDAHKRVDMVSDFTYIDDIAEAEDIQQSSTT